MIVSASLASAAGGAILIFGRFIDENGGGPGMRLRK
jgi:hypothetical protein